MDRQNAIKMYNYEILYKQKYFLGYSLQNIKIPTEDITKLRKIRSEACFKAVEF